MESARRTTITSWSQCFPFLVNFTRCSPLPIFTPTSRSSIPACVLAVFLIITFVRTCLYIVYIDSSNSAAIMVVFLLISVFGRMSLMLVKKAEYERYLENIDVILHRADHDFTALWCRDWLNLKLFLVILPTFGLGLFFDLCLVPYTLVTDPEHYISVYPFWAPGNDSKHNQWFYTMIDAFTDIAVGYLMVYFDVVYITLFKFQICQLRYLKHKADTMFADQTTAPSRGKIVGWIKDHQLALSMTQQVKQLMCPIMLTSYFYNLTSVGLAVLMLLQDKVSLDAALAVLVMMTTVLAQLGWECFLADKLEEEHQHVADSFNHESMYTGSQQQLSTWRMITRRVNKPLRFNALGFFNITLGGYKELLKIIYSTYAVMSEFMLEKSN